MDSLQRTSHMSGANTHYVEELYEHYLEDPASVPDEWRQYFDTLSAQDDSARKDKPLAPVRAAFEQLGRQGQHVQSSSQASSNDLRRQIGVLRLIDAYRLRGHQRAQLDPLGLRKRQPVPDLELSYHHLTEQDLSVEFPTDTLYFGKSQATLGEIIERLQQTYCRTIGCEFMHIVDTDEQHWLEQRVESIHGQPDFSAEEKRRILERLTAAEGLESYLASRYPGTKRFGLEGGDSFIPLVDELIQRSGQEGVKEVVIGMAHRGRLNLMVNILGKSPADLIDEFDGKHPVVEGAGDVKYHKGYSSNIMTPGGETHLALAFNPSHLEIVGPVIEGSVRARQDRRQDDRGDQVLPISVHGDAAFAAQGVVMETFQMSQTRGFTTGGTVHVVINNQVGFTTSDRADARSTEYCTDVAKMVQAPIFHVNGDDPEAVIEVARIALDYRQKFHKDVVIDLVCYRRRGHNEADEPSGTQPLMYATIKQHPTTRKLYADQLTSQKVITPDEVQHLVDEYRHHLDERSQVVNELVKEPNRQLFVDWTPYLGQSWFGDYDTPFNKARLIELANTLGRIPEGVDVQRQVAKVYSDRQKMIEGELPINWGFAETLAYATLLDEGHPVRISGEDSGRGTFSHRHAVIHNQKDDSTWVPLQHIKPEQPPFNIYDSLLSEEAVLAFEYGYATTSPKGLVAWEAQFGDFANGAQVVIDQFICSGETKWQRVCGLVLLLPHGYEGQGAEHSSARLERFLQLSSENNMQVVVPTTPAQMFHLLRRQVVRPLRKPLIVMQPKSLLRHKEAVSTLDDLADGRFQLVISDHGDVAAETIRHAIICSGKVYYDLLNYRREHERNDVAIIRVEQLYPFPNETLPKRLRELTSLESVCWCQDEPRNQGAWLILKDELAAAIETAHPGLENTLYYAGRDSSAAPAVGYIANHTLQQEALVNAAFNGDVESEHTS